MNSAFSSTSLTKTNKLRWKFYLANWIKKFIKWIKQQNDEPSTSRLNRKCFIFHEMNLMSCRYVSLWGLSQQQKIRKKISSKSCSRLNLMNVIRLQIRRENGMNFLIFPSTLFTMNKKCRCPRGCEMNHLIAVFNLSPSSLNTPIDS